jgi:predicted TPR repeat methyltransferase
MYNNELQLFQRSNEAIWTDEYISKSLLDAHLDEVHDAASRKSEKRINILNWISNNIKPCSKIIDLGCGPGLFAYELGKSKHNVLGVDYNKESINYAQKNKLIENTVQYKYCNYLKDTIEGKFNAAMIIYCDFGALIPDEQKLLLKKLYNLLDDEGLLFFDVFGKEVMKNKGGKKNWFISNGRDFWSEEPYFLMEELKLFEKENVLGTRYYLVNQINGKIKEYIMWDQYHDEQSIKKLLLENGFETIEIKKDLIENDEETLFIMAKKQKTFS